MTSLWLVTPVHGRYELARICLEQKARLVAELSARVQVHVLVIGEDENLGTARELGFHTLERPNVLGLRLNDGFEYAFREGGADHVCYVGSDDWLLAEHLADVPRQGRARSSRWAAWVSADGARIACVEHSPYKGCPPWTLSRRLLEPVGFRPADDTLRRYLDTSIMSGFRVPRSVAFEYHAEDDPLRSVGFKSRTEQMTSWRLLAPSRSARPNPFEVLATRYPADLVERMEEHYAS